MSYFVPLIKAIYLLIVLAITVWIGFVFGFYGVFFSALFENGGDFFLALMLLVLAFAPATIKLLTAGKFLEELRSRSLKICFSEITVWCRGPFPRLFDFKAQAMAYRQVFEFATQHGVKSFTIWGVNDATAWRHPKLAPFLFDDEYRPKPALVAIENFLLKRARENPTLALDYRL